MYSESLDDIDSIIRNLGEPEHLLMDFKKGAINTFYKKYEDCDIHVVHFILASAFGEKFGLSTRYGRGEEFALNLCVYILRQMRIFIFNINICVMYFL